MTRLITSLRDLPEELRGGGLAIGNFDAVHKGHAALIQQLRDLSTEVDGPAVVFTFDPPPGAVLNPGRSTIKPLTTIERRRQLLAALGIDGLVAYPTDREFLNQTAKEFFDRILVETFRARVMVEGPNFLFGRNREGNIDLLQRFCKQAGVRLHVMAPVQSGSSIVSSTRVRELVTLGSVKAANELLWEPYRIEGKVVQGARRGRQLGFPTANLSSIPVLLPAPGVYAGRVLNVEAKPVPAAIHIGPNPTFDEQEQKVEVHMIQWQGDVYENVLQVEVLDRVREIVKFPSMEALQSQLKNDIEACRVIASM